MPRKKRSLFGTEKRWKSRRGRETEEQRDRRLEMCRLRTGMSHERRTEKEVEMLERLETLLQSQVVDDEDDSSDGTESDEDEPIRLNIPKPEISINEFPLPAEPARNGNELDETGQVFERDVRPPEVPDTDEKIDLDNITSNNISEIDEPLVEVKAEVIDESYETFEFEESTLKVEDNTSSDSSPLKIESVTDASVSINSRDEITDSESNDFKNVILFNESICEVKFEEEDCEMNQEDIESSYLPEEEEVPVDDTDVKVERIFQCDICKIEYSSKARLKTHSLIHKIYPELKYTFKCHLCKRRFTRQLGLKKHLLSHNAATFGFKSFKCDVCEKTFKRRRKFFHHLLMHMSDRNLQYLYKCKTCGLGFIRMSTLKKHAYIHKTVDLFDPLYSFICDTCGKKFMQKCYLKRHISRYHLNSLGYLFECEVRSGEDNEPLFSIGASGPQNSVETSEVVIS